MLRGGPGWTQLPPEGVSFVLGDAKIAGTAKVAGYIALTADAAFRLEAQAGETLERRDGRSTPVHGEYAWFRRDAFDLTVKIARRPSEVLAALTGYALPLEGVLDLRASMNYQFMGGGTRAVKLRVPKDIAQNFHFEGPQIAERALADDVWTVTFQKELTGAYALSIAAQVPVAKEAAQDGGKGYSFTAKVPVISPLDVVRSSGLWAVEANTETEIRFDARGMNELDSLLAPQLADYAPRHRVIGVFGWLGADYALTLSGVRHAPAGMLTAVVDTLELNTVISTSGTHRHEAVYRLRSTGVEYLDVTLPPGAQLLSVAIDGTAVKPVADRPGSVRLPLPARRDADAPVLASITYETAAKAWQNRGTLALAAPSLAKEIPVLKSAWHVWVPDGFSYSKFESNLPVREEHAEEVLIKRMSRAPMRVGEELAGMIPHFEFKLPSFQSGSPTFTSTGRIMVSGQLRRDDSSAAYAEELVNFFGTQIEVMRSGEVLKGAKARVRAMRPDLPQEEVKVEVAQLPKTAVLELRVTAKSAEYAQAFADACMDEYIASKHEMRANRQEGAAVAVEDELVRMEKNMQTEEEEMHAFQKANNIGFLKEEGNNASTYLSQLNRQLADLKTELEMLQPGQVVPANKTRSDAITVQMKSIEARIKEWEAKALDLARRIAEWDRIRSKIERTKVLYDRLNGQLRSLDVYKNLDQDTVTVLEHASVPKNAPRSPQPARPSAGSAELKQGIAEVPPSRAAAPPTPPPPAQAALPAEPSLMKKNVVPDERSLDQVRKTAGLLPVMLDLPKNGRVLVFEGLFAPERLVIRYDDWWSRARGLWMWFVAGGVALYVLSGRRPWWRTLWAVLLLTAAPLCVSVAWTPVCNALLGGWLAGLVLNRIAAWCVFRERKEVLA